MPELTPLQIVHTYNDVCWGMHRRELVTELVANPLRRHHPGRTEVFTHEDMLRRYDGYFEKYAELRVAGSRAICEGPYVSLLWSFEMVGKDGGSQTISGIEIFKIENGKIVEVWNPNGVAEQYPAGAWPDFEK